MKPSLQLIGRLAPSPTGAQHLGNARTYLLAWLLARIQSGLLYLRIEDLDTPRTKMGAEALLLEDLRWLGLVWDRMEPDSRGDGFWGQSLRNRGYVLQSERIARYESILSILKDQERIYPCTCTRSEIEQASSAPHEQTPLANTSMPASPVDGLVYPGTCSFRQSADAEELDAKGIKFAWRFRFSSIVDTDKESDLASCSEMQMKWVDDFLGEQTIAPVSSLGDFVVARNYGPPAYQLAVVVDDHDMGIGQVVRGDDLVYSTYRQLALYKVLGWTPPRWFHAPLVVGPDGKRLAKRHGDTRLCTLREEGYSSRFILGLLAHSFGWIDRPDEIDLAELEAIARLDPAIIDRIPKKPIQIPLPNLP